MCRADCSGSIGRLSPRAPGRRPLPAPAAHAQSRYPLEIDVIAGSVVTLNVGKVMDQDTLSGSGQLVGDPWWEYTVTDAGGGTVLEEVPGSQNDLVAALIVTWQAPDTDGTVSVEVTATDVPTPPGVQWPPNAADADVVFAAYTVHVHQLEVYRMWQGGMTLYGDAYHPSAPNPPHAWDCEAWDDDGALPTLRYDRDNTSYPRIMAFPGWSWADVSVSLRGKGGWTGTVLPADLRLFAPWPEEGNPPEIWLVSEWEHDVTSLPTPQFTAHTSEQVLGVWIPARTDRFVTFHGNYTWDWHVDVNDSSYRTQVDIDDAELTWLGTLWGTPQGGVVPTPQRVAAVCGALAGFEDAYNLGRLAAVWGDSVLDFNLATFMGEWYDSVTGWSYIPDEDVWCLICQDYRPVFDEDGNVTGYATDPADCITGATLAAAAANLMGLEAEAKCLYPQPHRGNPTDWYDDRNCWAQNPNHPGNPVGFIAGGWNALEGVLHVDGWWYPVLPLYPPEDHPADVLARWGNAYACGYTDPGTGEWAWHPNGEGGAHRLVTEP